MGAKLVRARSAVPRLSKHLESPLAGEAGIAIEAAHDPAAIPEDRARQIADAFGLFGSPERCAERLLRAREEAGVDNVFLFPAHDLAGGYNMPDAEVQAFERIIRPRLGA